MASLELKGIKKEYEKKITAVHNFNLDIDDKEFIVFVGPSGCGKSTTLRMIAGLEEISEGELYINDKLMNEVASKDRDIAMVFQNYALYPHMTVFENMAFALKLKKVPKNEIKKRVEASAQILEITDLLKRKPKTLSGGQRQRVAIGRAIVREPKVFLMDEPLSNLDAKLRNQMRAEILKLHKKINTTFIYVTHDQTEAMTLGDRIVVMKAGMIQQIGKPNEVFGKPNNIFVASFIGSPQMNLIEGGKLRIKDNGYFIGIFNREFALPKEKTDQLRLLKVPCQNITVGIRPENLSLSEQPIQSSIAAAVEVSEQLGSETIVYSSIEGQNVTIRLTTPDACELFYNKNQRHKDHDITVHIVFDLLKIHIFNENGDNLLCS